VFLWLLKAAKKELTLPPSLSADQLRAYTGYSQPEAPSLFGCSLVHPAPDPVPAFDPDSWTLSRTLVLSAVDSRCDRPDPQLVTRSVNVFSGID
jgi:hypothetical protein